VNRLSFQALLILFLIPILNGCQSKVYLMPAPVGIVSNSQFFRLSEKNIDENLLYTLYATNRIPFDKANESTGYTIFPSDTLELGYLVHSVGEDGMSWQELYGESLSSEREKDLLITQQFVKPMAVYHKDADPAEASDRATGFFHKINEALDQSFIREITVYVHGANSNFYRATAQGAQLFHYTGHNALVLTFSWPSAENIFKYKVDVLHAKKTVPAFARLLEILALHTKAEHINIIAYSAGAQVVAPGLVYISEQYPELSTLEIKKRLRIGEVYFAAPDTAFKAFVERYLKFRNIVDRTSIILNGNDRILFFAEMQNGVSSLGRPNDSELDATEKKIILEAMATPELNVIDAGGSRALNVGSGHDFWYSNTWVSTDLLMLLFFNASPEERGLVGGIGKSGADLFYFPDDYHEIVPSLMQKQKERIIRLRSETEE